MNKTNIALDTIPIRGSASLNLNTVNDGLVRLSTLLALWHYRWSTRRHLKDLESYRLEDVGISPTERTREVQKPFWRC